MQQAIIATHKVSAIGMDTLTTTQRAMIWIALALLVALLCVVGFRGYLSSEMLFNFANRFYC